MGQGVQFFFGISHCTQHTIAISSVLIALWDFWMQLKSKGHLVSLGFVLVSFPIHAWDYCAMEIKGLFGFMKFRVKFFPPPLYITWNFCAIEIKGFISFCFISSGFVLLGFVFFFPLYIHQSRLFTQSILKRGVPRVLCCFFAQCPKNTMAKKKLVAKGKFGKKKPKSCHHVFSHQNVKSWTKCQRWTTKHKFLDPHYYYYYYYHTKLLLLFMLLRCNFQSRNPETPHP